MIRIANDILELTLTQYLPDEIYRCARTCHELNKRVDTIRGKMLIVLSKIEDPFIDRIINYSTEFGDATSPTQKLHVLAKELKRERTFQQTRTLARILGTRPFYIIDDDKIGDNPRNFSEIHRRHLFYEIYKKDHSTFNGINLKFIPQLDIDQALEITVKNDLFEMFKTLLSHSNNSSKILHLAVVHHRTEMVGHLLKTRILDSTEGLNAACFSNEPLFVQMILQSFSLPCSERELKQIESVLFRSIRFNQEDILNVVLKFPLLSRELLEYARDLALYAHILTDAKTRFPEENVEEIYKWVTQDDYKTGFFDRRKKEREAIRAAVPSRCKLQESPPHLGDRTEMITKLNKELIRRFIQKETVA